MNKGIAITALLVCSGVAHADDPAMEVGASAPASPGLGPTKMEVGVFAGGFVSNFYHQFYDTKIMNRPELATVNPEAGARFSYFFHKYIGAEAEGSVVVGNVEDTSSNALIYGIGAQIVAQYPWQLTPFVDVGASIEHLSSSDTVLGSDTDTLIHAGIGVRWYVADQLAIRADAKLMRGPSSKDPYTLDASYGTFSVGLSYVIGSVPHAEVAPVDPDPDHDGLVGEADRCPAEAANTADGCPDRDRDKDGIDNDLDKCPDEAENKNGFQDDDGCVDTIPDSDTDGLDDMTDKCPAEAEDKDGFQDEDGCPDPDNDADSVPDGSDKCPAQAGPADNGGCPDTDGDKDSIVDRLDSCPTVAGTDKFFGCKAKMRVQLEPKDVKLVEAVAFRGTTAKLPAKVAVLDDVAAVLAAHPEILHITVHAFTDNQGKAEKNQKLTDDRAQAVVAYLVKKGVAAQRVSGTGHGSDQPIADNATAKGRAANRRIEIRVE